MSKKTQTQKPVAQIRLGRMSASIFANDTKVGTRYNVLFQRSYLDKDDAWQNTSSFGRDDLLVLAKIANLAHTKIFELHQEESDDE